MNTKTYEFPHSRAGLGCMNLNVVVVVVNEHKAITK